MLQLTEMVLNFLGHFCRMHNTRMVKCVMFVIRDQLRDQIELRMAVWCQGLVQDRCAQADPVGTGRCQQRNTVKHAIETNGLWRPKEQNKYLYLLLQKTLVTTLLYKDAKMNIWHACYVLILIMLLWHVTGGAAEEKWEAVQSEAFGEIQIHACWCFKMEQLETTATETCLDSGSLFSTNSSKMLSI